MPVSTKFMILNSCSSLYTDHNDVPYARQGSDEAITMQSIVGQIMGEVDDYEGFKIFVHRECVLQDTIRAINRSHFSVRKPITVSHHY